MTHQLVVALPNVSATIFMRHVFHLLLQPRLLPLPRLYFRLLVHLHLVVPRMSLARAMQIVARINAEGRRRRAGNNVDLYHIKIISYTDCIAL